jgi:hypothetical protein
MLSRRAENLRNSGLFEFWLRFGSVTGFFKPAPSPKPRQNPKILAAHRYIISVIALVSVSKREFWRRDKASRTDAASFQFVGSAVGDSGFFVLQLGRG